MADQYVLARLGLEMLEGKSFDQILGGKPVEKLEKFWTDPAGFITGDWKDNHPQLWEILKKMLKRIPDERWKFDKDDVDGMTYVERKLRAVEESGRALAKRTYVMPHDAKVEIFPLKGNTAFFKEFYDSFFNAAKEAERKFDKPIDQQYPKLMKALVSVLNFREGNSPTSLDEFLKKHQDKGVRKDEFEKFHQCFLEMLKKKHASEEVVKAWDDLFKPVVEYMVRECVGDSGADSAKRNDGKLPTSDVTSTARKVSSPTKSGSTRRSGQAGRSRRRAESHT